MTEQQKMKSGLLQSAKVRVTLFVVGLIAVTVVVFMVWHHYRVQLNYKSSAAIISAPAVENTPGAGNPSDNYVKTQDTENTELDKKARKEATSSIPTITRASFSGDDDSFNQKDSVFPTTPQTAVANKSCPLSKVVYMYRPNPANCSVPNLKLAREAGVTAEELRCQACSCPALRASGYTAGELKDTGYNANDLKTCGFNLQQLMDAGYNAKDLKDAGFSADQLRRAGFSAGQLAAAGFTPNQLKAAGYTEAELKKAGLIEKPSAAKSGDCSVARLRKARERGESATLLKNQGCDAAAMKAAGFTAGELKAAGYSAKDLKNAGFTPKELHDAGYSAADLKAAGFDAKALKDAGYSAAQLKDAGFSAGDLKNAGFNAAQLKDAGFNAAQLRDAGFSAGDLKKAGFSADQLKKAGFTKGDLLRAGFTPKQAGLVTEKVVPRAADGQSSPAVSHRALEADGNAGGGISSIDGSSQAAQIRALQDAQQRAMSQQQKQDALLQIQGQMMKEAEKMMVGWGKATPQTGATAPEPSASAENAATAAAGKTKDAAAPTGPTIKAGTIMFGVLDTSINSDETSTPVMATIVSGKLKGAKLLGQFTRVDKRLLLKFSLVNVPSFEKSFSANVVAIDPDTAHTAMAGYVNNHYLLRYGSLFASSFLSGVSQGIMQSGTSENCFGPFCVKSHRNLNTSDYIGLGLGQTGQQYANSMASNFNVPPTVKIPGGVPIGLLFMQDSILPEPLVEKNKYGLVVNQNNSALNAVGGDNS